MSDKFFSNVTFLCGFNGADGATSATDESNAGRTITFVNNSQLDTAQLRFGSASLLLDGTDDYLTVPDHADWTFAADPWSVEAWIRWNTGAGGLQTWCSHYNATGNQRGWVVGTNSNAIRLLYSTTGSNALILSAPWTPSNGVWYFTGVYRSGPTVYFTVDGVLLGTGNIGTDSIFNSTAALQIGTQGLGADADFNGWIDEVRITTGVCRQTTSFTPPIGPWARRKYLGVANQFAQPVINRYR